MATLKHCKLCDRDLPLTRFAQEDGYKDGIGRHQCRRCRYLQTKLRQAKLPVIPGGKSCSCGMSHWKRVPANNKYQQCYEIYFWDCLICGSTLTFIPNKERTSQLLKGEKPS